jgi:hypothetical protein
MGRMSFMQELKELAQAIAGVQRRRCARQTASGRRWPYGRGPSAAGVRN